MPVSSISISRLFWSTPDGHPVLRDLTLAFGCERVGLVGRNGVGKSTLLSILAGRIGPSKGNVRVEGTIGTMRQIVQTSHHETIADLLGITTSLSVLRKAEAGMATMDELAAADWTLEARVEATLAEMGLRLPLDTPPAQLSGGQNTRVALAALLLDKPDFLLLDEPTNDLDRDGRQAVREMLQRWRGGAIVVSHDREVLETMDSIVELTSLGATRYGGNWTHYRECKATELAAAEHNLVTADRQRAEIARKSQVAHERKQRRDSVGSKAATRGGMPKILLGARREQAENSGAGNVRLAERQRSEADRAVEQARKRIERFEPLTVSINPTGLSPSRDVLTLERVCAGYDGGPAVLSDVSLKIVGPERIALVGANGSGKSTLLRLVAGTLEPTSGLVRRHTPWAMLDQTVSILQREETIAGNFMRLNPNEDENGCRASLARFRFRAEAADQLVRTLSGGQMLRAGLACVLGNSAPPPLLILDEPTNHLDMEAISAVEAGLVAYDGALIVVSHDPRFLEQIGITRRWSMVDGQVIDDR